ncbi:MAG: penicillin-binding transpeptidase domain-containing protein [Leptospiraceae bacterium]|nr:penicillin-binding transpeptidase domain-containing protein [Leptospiraceae bacterium]MDW8306129.1 penicillin-binding transpeptidase domain-containing protein [Leptospiraceae bacterium]
MALIFFMRAYQLTFDSPLPPAVQESRPPIRRGIIFDALNRELAISRDTASIGIRPEEIDNPEQTSRLLSRILKIPKSEILQKIQDKEKKFIYLTRKTPMEDVEEIRSLNLPGLVFHEEPDRFYPNGRLASTVLGFTGLDNEGLAGIEFQYDSELRHAGKNSYVGRNIHLTINGYVQYHLEKALHSQFEKVKAVGAVGIISETKTGKILALASLPDFNPNEARSFSADEQRNRALTDVSEPGSTFKVFVLAALFREKLLDETRTYYCPGYFQYKNHRIRCTGKHGEQNLAQVMANSCNTGIIEASWQMPVLKLYENLRRFGFGSQTEIDLPAEAKGYLPLPKDWDIYLKMTIPIGHGVSVTPIQLIAAANALANGGEYVRPFIVEKITTPDGKVVESFGPKNKVKISDDIVKRKVLFYLQKVVEEGTGLAARLEGMPYKVCGKTGTAIKSDRFGYKQKKYQASFLGFFPCEEPEVSIFIMFDEPRGELYQGGQIAAPVFREVLRQIIPHIHQGEIQRVQNLAPINYNKLEFNPEFVPDLRGKSKKEVLQILWRYYPGEHELFGAGYVESQEPPPKTKINGMPKFKIRFSFP